MVFGRHAFFGYLIREQMAYWFTNVFDPDPYPDAVVGPTTCLNRLQQRHRSDPFPIPQILDAADAVLGQWPVYDVPHLKTWHTPRICLIGDAAHATSPSAGQGASLALEDAAVLGRCLTGATTPTAAFAMFQRLRKPRAEAVVELGRRLGETKAPTGASAWFRDRMLPVFLRLGARRTTALYRYRTPERCEPAAGSGSRSM